MPSAITGMTELTTPAADDVSEIVDISDTSQAPTGTNKRITWLTLITKMFASRFGADAGSTDTYVVTLSPVPAAYVTGEHYRFKANTANTGACTVNFNSLGAKTIKKAAGGITTDLADNDIRAGQWVDLVYDGTNMQMQSLLGNAPAGGAGGIGDVVGPSSATDNALARFDSTTGKLIQNSTVTLDDTGAITVPEMAAPSTPGVNKVALYAKADGLLYSKDDAGAETLVSGGGSAYSGVTTGGTGSLDMAQGTKTADEPFIDASVTWNNGAVNFNGIKTNSVVTAAGSGSKLLDLQIGGVSQFSVQAVSGSSQWAALVPAGSNSRPGLSFQGDNTTGLSYSSNIEFNVAGSVQFRVNNGDIHIIPAGGIEQRNGGPYRWQSSTRILSVSNGIVRIEGNSDDQGVALVLGNSGSATTGIRLKRSSANFEVKVGDDSAYTKAVASQFCYSGTTVCDFAGSGSPEGAITASVGSTYRQTNATGSALWIKESGSGNTGWVLGRLDFIQLACSDETTALATGTAKITFRMPFAMTLTAVRASLSTAQASGSIFTVDINEGGTTILSTKLTIDNTEKTSTTAATPAVISDTALADDAEITVDIDQIGSGDATGLKITLIGVRG